MSSAPVRKLFGTDGIRGTANVHPMTPEVAMALGRAIATVFRAAEGERKQNGGAGQRGRRAARRRAATAARVLRRRAALGGVGAGASGCTRSAVARRTTAVRTAGARTTPSAARTAPNAGGTISADTLHYPSGLAMDSAGNLYVADDNYTDPNGGEVYRLELAPATCVSGNFDVNGDGTVSTLDIQLVAGDWYRADYDPDYDVNCDSVVDILDIQETAAAWTG